MSSDDRQDPPTVVDSELTERLMVVPAPGRHRAEQPLEFAPSIRYGAAAFGLMLVVVMVWYSLTSGPAELAVRQPLPGTAIPYPPPATSTPNAPVELVTDAPASMSLAAPTRRPTPLRRVSVAPPPAPGIATTTAPTPVPGPTTTTSETTHRHHRQDRTSATDAAGISGETSTSPPLTTASGPP